MKKEIPPHWFQNSNASLEEAKSSFLAPPAEYAPFAFWFWDSPLNGGHAAYQAREICKQGISPGYLQHRGADEYLTEKWFRTIGAALQEAEANGMPMGFCDEIGAPCGIVGGRLPKERPELTAVSLRWDITDVQAGQTAELPDAFFTVAAELDGKTGRLHSYIIEEKERGYVQYGDKVATIDDVYTQAMRDLTTAH